MYEQSYKCKQSFNIVFQKVPDILKNPRLTRINVINNGRIQQMGFVRMACFLKQTFQCPFLKKAQTENPKNIILWPLNRRLINC